MNFGKNLRYLRKKNDMSQQDIADMLHYKSFVTVQYWESGKSSPSVEVIQKLCNLFKTDLKTLLYSDMEKEELTPQPVSIEMYSPEMKQVIDIMIEQPTDKQKLILDIVKRLSEGGKEI